MVTLQQLFVRFNVKTFIFCFHTRKRFHDNCDFKEHIRWAGLDTAVGIDCVNCFDSHRSPLHLTGHFHSFIHRVCVLRSRLSFGRNRVVIKKNIYI